MPCLGPISDRGQNVVSSVADFQSLRLSVLCQVCVPSSRPFYVEPTNIVSISDVIQRVSDRASAMNKRIHYYSRLTAPADKALVRLGVARRPRFRWDEQ